ncbi:MAG: (2Fe-2S)-binding protein [Deltaproteobacteria bacterium]|nr:(2Fe-2S)-binding protein [Deltaproteobacteria bacterium]
MVNGASREARIRPGETLLEMLRNRLGLKGTKCGCEIGECGACTVVMDGVAVNSCMVLAAQAEGARVTTVEGLARDGRLHPLQEAFLELGAVQCGFCTPGMLMSALALLEIRPRPTRDEVARAIAGNLCRCTGYQMVVDSIMKAAEVMNA